MFGWVSRAWLGTLTSVLCLTWTLVAGVTVDAIHRPSHRNHIACTLDDLNTCSSSVKGCFLSDEGSFGKGSLWRTPRQPCHGRLAFLNTKVLNGDLSAAKRSDKATCYIGWGGSVDSNRNRRSHLAKCSMSFGKRMEGADPEDDPNGTGNGVTGGKSEPYSAGIAGDPSGIKNQASFNDVALKSSSSSTETGEVTEEAKPGEITDEDIMKMKVALSQQATLGVDFVKCIETLQTSPYCTVSPTTIAYNATLSAAERNSNARLTLAIVEDMRKKGNVLDGVSYKLATTTCAKCGYIDEALKLYDEMLKNGHCADHGVMRALMAQLAKEGNGMDCLRIYEDMKRLEKVRQGDEKFMQPEDYMKVIEACTKAQMYAEALEAYKEMKTHKKYAVTRVVVTEILTLCYSAGNWQEAMELYGTMLKEKTPLTLYQYKLLLSIMFISRKYSHLESIYNTIQSEGVHMDYMSYQLVLEGYAKTGQFQKALRLIEKMEPQGFLHGIYEPFIAAAEACRQCGEWKLALKLLRKANDHNTNRSITMYNTVLSVFAAAEEWDGIISLYKEIEDACKEFTNAANKLSMDGDTVAYAVMAHFYSGDKAQVDRLLRLPIVETMLLLKVRKNIDAERNAMAPKEVEGAQG